MDLHAWVAHVLQQIEIAMQDGQYQEALFHIHQAFRLMPQSSPQQLIVGKLLLYSAECNWHLNNHYRCLDELAQAHQLIAPAPSDRKESFDKWIHRTEKLLDLSSPCAKDFAKFCWNVLANDQREQAQCSIVLGIICGVKELIWQAYRMNRKVLEEYQSRWKVSGIKAMQRKDYPLAKKLLQRALMLSKDDRYIEAHRSILSHLATVHFHLREYNLALEAGQLLSNLECFPSVQDEDEANRWKDRGNKLFQEKNFELTFQFYTLAIEFTPQGSQFKELRSTLLANRSAAYCKLGKFQEAFVDATLSVEHNPIWSKGHYRLGTSLVGLRRYHEGCEAFSEALNFADNPKDKKDVLLQIINSAVNIPSGLAGVQVFIPKPLVQDLVNHFVEKKDWEKLGFLFLGGSGIPLHIHGQGGLATGCDASCVPLELIVSATIKTINVPNFVEALIKNGAPFEGSPGCSESPLKIATRKKDQKLLDVLQKYDKSNAVNFLEKGKSAFDQKDFRKAINMLDTAVKGELSPSQFLLAYHLLSDSYYEVKDYHNCIDYAWKAFKKNPQQVKEYAEKWKNRGNGLLELKLYDVMTEFYSLALQYAPTSCTDMRAAIYSNRSMAYVNQQKMKEAKDDAQHCINLKKTWFRGYSRLGACWAAEMRYDEAINEYCKGIHAVKTDNEKSSLLTEILNACVKLPDVIITLPINIPTKLMNSVVKQAVKDKDVIKLKRLFVEKRYRLPGSREPQCLGNACDCVSFIPLEMIIESGISEKDRLIEELLSRGASPNGLDSSRQPPVCLALNERNYKTAVALLRHGANHQVILKNRREPFDPKAQHLIQWLNLGRKAFRNNEFSRAETYYSLALEYPEVTNDKSAQSEALKALSDICFEQRQYEECMIKGKECFKVNPQKSENEAQKWQKRASVLVDKEMHPMVPSYLTHAMNYAPPSNGQLRFELLCSRSDAYKKIKDYRQAIEDGNNATKIKPGEIQGYRCLIDCYKTLDRPSKTLLALSKCLNAVNISPDERHTYFVDALNIAASLPEGTTVLKVEVPRSSLQQIHDEAVQSGNWEQVRLLYLGGGGPQNYEVRKGGLGTNCICSKNVPVEDMVSASFSLKAETLAAVIDHGANVNGLRGNVNPLVIAATKKDVETIKVFVERGANPCIKSEGLPLLHKEVKKAMDTGDLEVLQMLLTSPHPDVQNVQDSNGNTLFHIPMTGKKNTEKCKVLRCLINAKINPVLPNKQGKQPIDCCNKKDDRNKMLKKFMKEYIPKPVKESKTANVQKESSNDSCNPMQSSPKDTLEDRATPQETEHKDSWEDRAMKDVENKPPCERVIVEEPKMPISKRKVDIITTKKKEDERSEMLYLIEHLDIELINAATKGGSHVEDTADKLNSFEIEHDPEEQDTLEDDKDAYEEDEAPTPNAANGEIEADDLASPFENLTWEVDCTENVWKSMRSRKVPEKTKEQIIRKIRMLAEGRWGKKLCKRLEGEAKEKGILLYESRITRSSRILWEKTIAFSARCSNDPKLRLSAGNQGLIYSDIIRVWDIVLDHKDLEHRIQNIVKSHDRGSHCIVKAELKGMKNQKQSESQLSLPSYYQERKIIKEKQSTVEEKGDVRFFPPASSEDNEYHILKFYSFTSALIETLLDNDQKSKIDFPFKVTELEHAIINLKTDKPRAIILLGRSGTGKTTCCLYRLWTEFQVYWERATTAGPHIPKCIPSEMTRDDDEEEDCKDAASSLSTTADYLQEDHSHDQCSYLSEASVSSQVEFVWKPYESEEEEKTEDSSPDDYEHLHQMFITKNTVLCSEVQKNFKELKNACPETKHLVKTDDSLPNHIDEIDEEAWPLFIGSRDWLLLLDASLPGITFFKRAKDGSLLGKIEGWGQEDTHLHFIPDDDDDDDDELDDKVEHEGAIPENADKHTSKSDKKSSNKREVTYEVFINELWPKMKKSVKNDFHPTLVWTEIRSFIKGSAEALKTKNGYLSCDEYEDLGRKRAPNFMGDRSTVYQLFKNYQHIIRSSRTMFDEADLVYNLHQRLIKNQDIEWSIHNIYVDETQDFTQAELHLLILCCRFPNRMFFTGDTAQSIMRGIAFRFEDLKTLFHVIQTSDLKKSKRELVRVPHRPYQLTHNYRSHAGILRLASSIVNLLQDYFPESFDRLEKDCGLFEGPKPVLLESCSLTDLAMILRGNKRQASRIEFGAHQAVLVVSDEAREKMPDELKYGLVLTIYEAKGLEFDDVLIYNFFKDSHARKEWRVVTSYIEKSRAEACSATTGLVQIQEEDLNLRSRPLEFNPEKHKVLNSELKFLYTAITRARVNVWFFDEDEENRAPMFEYFQRQDLVRAITLDDREEGTTALSSMFAEGSTVSEWRDQGHFFYNKNLWDVAERCFTFGNDEMMVRRCKAQKRAQEALQNRSNPKLMKEMFCTAAKEFLDCGMPAEAEVCLYNCREKVLLANLYKKMQRFAEASKLFRVEKCYDEASQCMEEINNYNQAIEIFCEANLYEKAIQVLERYNSLNVEKSLENHGIVPPKPNRTIERLCYKLAETYYSEGSRQEMEAILQRLPPGDRISFFKKHNCVEEAARALVEDEKKEEAARFLKLHGRFKEAMKYSEDPKFLADCNLFEARSLIISKRDGRKIDVKAETVEELLEGALKYYKKCSDKSGEGEAMLLLGLQRDNISDIQESGKAFSNNDDVCGEARCVEEMLERDASPFYYRIFVRSIERLLELIVNLHKPYTEHKADKQREITLCEKFFGLYTTPDQCFRRYFTRTSERFQDLCDTNGLIEGVTSTEKEVGVKIAYNTLARHLTKKAISLVHNTTKFFMSKLKDDEQPSGPAAFNGRFEILFNWVYLDGVVLKFQNQMKRLEASPISPQSIESLSPEESKSYTSCNLLFKFMFPEAGPDTLQISQDQIMRIRKHHAVRAMLTSFCESLCKETKNSRYLRIDALLQISYLMQIQDNHDRMNQFLKEKEHFFQKLAVGKKQTLMHESGMLATTDQSFEIFFRHWETARTILHIYGNVLDSLHLTCRRFLTYAAKNRSLTYPSIANTVMILEHQLTVALLMYSRLKDQQSTYSCIPESYLSRLAFMDSVNRTRVKHFFTRQAIDEFVRKLNSKEEQKSQRSLHNLLNYIVNLMFGGISNHFNVYVDTFSSQETEQLVKSGVAERVMILALTMLVNCGRTFEVQKVILQNVFSVMPPASLPGHLKDAFRKLNDARSFGNVVEILKAILSARRGEKLFAFRWKEYAKGLDKLHVAQPDTHCSMFAVDVSEIKLSISQVDSAESHLQSPSSQSGKEQDEGQDDFDSEAQNFADNVREKERKEERDELHATITIQKYFRKYRQRKFVGMKMEEDIGSDTEVLQSFDRLSSQFKIDSSGCAICGVTFTLDESSLNLQDHIVSDSHMESEKEFQEYKEFYNKCIESVLSQAKALHQEVDKTLDLDVDMQELEEMSQKAWDIVQNIEKGRKWKDAKGLKPLIQKIESKVQNIQNMTVEVQGQAEDSGKDDDYDDVEDDEIVTKPMPTTKDQKKGKGSKSRNRKRRK